MAKNSRTKLGADLKKRFWISKRIFTDKFHKKYPFSNSFSPFRNQNLVLSMPKDTNMVTLLGFTDFTPITLFNYKELYSMNVKVQQNVPGFLWD